jgi:hypothetical protein
MRTFAVLLFVVLAFAGIGFADIVPLNPYVSNASFEVPMTLGCNFPTGWSQNGTATGDAGNWNPSACPPGNTAGLVALDGKQVGYINNSSGENGLSN